MTVNCIFHADVSLLLPVKATAPSSSRTSCITPAYQFCSISSTELSLLVRQTAADLLLIISWIYLHSIISLLLFRQTATDLLLIM